MPVFRSVRNSGIQNMINAVREMSAFCDQRNMLGFPNMKPEVTTRAVVEQLSSRLPSGWEVSVAATGAIAAEPDFRLHLTAPDGQSAFLICETKATVMPKDVPGIADRLASFTADTNTQGVVTARYLSVNVRNALVDAGVGYIDLAGSIRVSVARPGLFISERGPESDPWRGPGRPRESLRGEPAARVVRTLLDHRPPISVRELVEVSGASTGATYRVVDYLEDQGLIDRDNSRRVVLKDWPGLLRHWARDYQFVGTNNTTRWLAPRGLRALLTSISTSERMDYVVTGSLAASAWAPYADSKLAMVYVKDAESAAQEWGLRKVDAGANVLLSEPRFNVVFVRPRLVDLFASIRVASPVRVAAPSQVAVDLLSGPGRNPSEGEALIEWMLRDEEAWRV
jgi:hypothetical protein